MKIRILTLFISLFLVINCREIPPQIGGTQEPIENPDKKVLIEEYTGVRCGNCPAGSSLLQSLKQDLGEQIVIVSFHAGFFAKPYPSSTQDFKTEETEALQSFLGEPLGYPAATINRKIFDDSRILNASEWAAQIQEELTIPSPYALSNEVSYDGSSRDLDIKITATAFQLGPEEVFLSVYIVEDNIANAQATPNEIQEDYKHHAILRKILTPIIGNKIDLSTINESQVVSYSYNLNPLWEANNVSIVSFLHQNGDKLDVLQAEEVSLSE